MSPTGRRAAAGPTVRDRAGRRFEAGGELSVADLRAAAVLGEAGLRDPAALRCRNRRGDVSPGDRIARARPRAVAGGLCAAVAPTDRRALWREPQPLAAL